MKVHKTRNYVRYRVRSPTLFVRGSFRTHDIGRAGHSKRIAGRLKRNGRWSTQSVLISRKDYDAGMRVKSVKGRAFIYKKR